MSWHVTAVRPEDINTFWPIAEPLLAPAVEVTSGRIGMESVFIRLQSGVYLLWVAHQDDLDIKAAFLTREAQYPDKKVLTIECAGGTQMHGWLEEASKVFRAHSRAAGLTGVELYGRPGWTRALKSLGWRQSVVVCEIDM